ncbi:MAG: hypothetical protein K2X03_01950 [Bryobacteraceae bacterium]|nr:hypothetical protein [Bryobacteraceae bacterium]
MPRLTNFFYLLALPALAHTYRLEPADLPGYREFFLSLGFEESQVAPVIAVQNTKSTAGLQIVTGPFLGAVAGDRKVKVRSAVDVFRPSLEIVWEHEEFLPTYTLPAGAKVYTWDRWTQAPLAASWKQDRQTILWLATSLGEHGYEKFPYLAQALVELGFAPPYRGRDLWAFFDSGYRARADFDYLAAQWRRAGIAALHVASWHYFEASEEKSAELERLILACHRQRILVYAWIELPHVSEQFWQRHPEWREKTGNGQDAQLDWRKLVSLHDPDCAKAVASGIGQMLNRFDWDGANLAELYFESLEGVANPARFTPMNATVRQEYLALKGHDPVSIFTHPERVPAFLEYRAALATKLQTEWLERLAAIRKQKPGGFDLTWTHIDDRFDTRMRDLLGADSGRALPLAKQYSATFLIEDPATVWHLGPRRYVEIAKRYPRDARLAIDLNIVERYQDVYPAKQQTGAELFSLIHHAAQSFPRVALYFERSILPPDYPLLASASAVKPKRLGGNRFEAERPFGLAHSGALTVNGEPWPVTDGEIAWLPAGKLAIAPATRLPEFRLLDLNAELLAASARRDGIDFAYRSNARALAQFSAPLTGLEIDGQPVTPTWIDQPKGVIALPAGQHRVRAIHLGKT